MTILRWLGAAVLVCTVGCTGNVADVPDGSASAGDGSRPEDATSSSDANLGDAGPGDAGSADAACVTGSLTFLLTQAPGAATGYCLGAPNSCLAFDALRVRPAGGAALNLNDSCQTPCGTCQGVECPLICAVPIRLGDAGYQAAWDGTYYPSGTCGSGTACVTQACASPGNYVARFCGHAAPPDASAIQCEGASTATCVETPFVWPPPADGTTVQGVLGAPPVADAGPCCPSGWGLSSCTFPDGGTGEQCHNPALGCASSTTCGQGCDSVVTGRCDGG